MALISVRGWSAWLSERLRTQKLLEFLEVKRVPVHRYSVGYVFGGLALFFFFIQLVSGILLLLYYSPTPESAYQSMKLITEHVTYGGIVRSVHWWSASLMVATVFMHLSVVFLMKAYRKPREVTWWSGLFMLSVVLGLAFTGSLLPWDTRAYFATLIGTEIPKSIPLVGDFIVTLLRGGDYVGDETLKRFFALHVVVLPLAGLGGIGLHLMLNQVHPTSVPLSLAGKDLPSRSFLRGYVSRELAVWVGATVGLVLLASWFPAGLGIQADPYASAPVGVKPDWYFLILFQTLRMLPVEILGMNSEILLHTGLVVLAGLLVTLPFWDRSERLGRSDPKVKVFGLLVASYWVFATIAGIVY